LKQVFIVFATVYLFIGFILGQTRRIVLLEEATNASCSPCATYNPGLQDFISNHFGGVISVRYHASWPGTDPMYATNTKENNTRIQYYGISGVPGYTIDGHLYGVPSNPGAIKAQMLDRLDVSSSVKLNVHATFNYDSISSHIEIIPLSEVTQTNVFLRIALIERMVTYPYAPGTNGEKEFGDVMRKMLPNPAGTSITTFSMGDTMRFDFTQSVDPNWVAEDMSVVAWLQSDDTKEVIQANIDFPTCILESSAPALDLLAADSMVQKSYKIVNLNDDTLDTKIYVKDVKADADWVYTLNYQDDDFDLLPVQIQPGDSIEFFLKMNTAQRGSIELTVFAEHLNDPAFYGEGYGYGYGKSYKGVIPYNNDILLVDDDGGSDFEKNFEAVFNQHENKYITISQSMLTDFTDLVNLNDYSMLIWNVSWGFPAFTPSDIEILTAYLDNGGSVMVLGQDIGWDVFDGNGSSNFSAAQNFYHNYLGADYLADNSSGLQIVGIDGDPISNGLAFSLERSYGWSDFYPEEIGSYQNKAVPVFLYNNDKTGAVKYDNGTFRTVYFGFGFEQIAGDENKEIVLERTLEWAANITDIPNEDQFVPIEFSLSQNYPNPFNPLTRIIYQVARQSHITLIVYNMLGQKIQTMVDRNQEAGTYTLDFNAESLSSGIYYYKLETGNGYSQIKKMVLMK